MLQVYWKSNALISSYLIVARACQDESHASIVVPELSAIRLWIVIIAPMRTLHSSEPFLACRVSGFSFIDFHWLDWGSSHLLKQSCQRSSNFFLSWLYSLSPAIIPPRIQSFAWLSPKTCSSLSALNQQYSSFTICLEGRHRLLEWILRRIYGRCMKTSSSSTKYQKHFRQLRGSGILPSYIQLTVSLLWNVAMILAHLA